MTNKKTDRLERIASALLLAGPEGLERIDRVTIRRADGTEAPALIARHNYAGLYPTREALQAYEHAARIARAHGWRAEPRGHYTATLICAP